MPRQSRIPTSMPMPPLPIVHQWTARCASTAPVAARSAWAAARLLGDRRRLVRQDEFPWQSGGRHLTRQVDQAVFHGAQALGHLVQRQIVAGRRRARGSSS